MRERHPDNWYPENPWCAEVLADHERFHGLIYDPACGSGNIPKAFLAKGHKVMATDLAADRPYGTGGVDFLADSWSPPGVDNIITNPPYDGATMAQRFIEKALRVATRKVAAFLPLQFLSSQSRHPFFNNTPPVRLYILSQRPSCPPGDLLLAGKVKQAGGMRDYCWIVWEVQRRSFTPCTVSWIMPE